MTKKELELELARVREENSRLAKLVVAPKPKYTALSGVVAAMVELGPTAEKSVLVARADELIRANGGKASTDKGGAIEFAIGQVRQALAAGMSLPAKTTSEPASEQPAA